jgi:hypothetical protein
MKKKNNLESAVYVSAVAVAMGVFLPLTHLPIYGDVTYYRIAHLEALLVVLFALAAPAMLYVKKNKLLWLAPAAICLTLLFPAIKGLLSPKGKGGVFGQLGDSASSAMGEFATNIFMNIADFSWGGVIFILGLLALSVSCSLRSRMR